MRVPILIILIAVLSNSCSKYRLNGDKEILVGEWEWVSSDLEDLGSTGGTYSVSPSTEAFTAALVFERRNKLSLIKNDAEQSTGRIKFEYFDQSNDASGLFTWQGKFEYKSNGETKVFNVQFYTGSNDTLSIQQFPLEDSGTTNVRYNYFVRR